MNESQKAGAVVIVVSTLAIIAAIFMSKGWAFAANILYNFLFAMRIQFYDLDESFHTCGPDHECDFLVDVPTKFVVLLFLVTWSYGLLVYLSIIPAPWLERVLQQGRSFIHGAGNEDEG